MDWQTIHKVNIIIMSGQEKDKIMNHKAKNPLPCALKSCWLIAVMLLCLAQPLSGDVQKSQISQFGITWTFNKDYSVGQFANGDYWVVGPVTIIKIDPASVEVNGRIINGSMVNPSPRLDRRQGYDSAMYERYARAEDYDPSLNVARPNGRVLSESSPLVLQPNCSLVSTVSTAEANGSTQLKTAAVLTILGSSAPEGSFRPSYSGTDKTIRFHTSQLSYNLLASLKPVPNTPALSTVERYYERPWLDHIPGWPGRSHHPVDNMPNYDREVITQVGIAALMLNLNFDDQKKETLLVRFIQVGIDNYGVIQDGGRENWLQDSGRKFPILFAGLMLNDPDMKNIGKKSGDYLYTDPYGPGNPPPDLIRFEEDEMTFYVSQSDVDMTHSPEWKPDSRDAEKISYKIEDIGLPEWGKVQLYDRRYINKYWATTYRQVIGHAYSGIVLAMHIMGVKNLWNHDALFDYKDRYKKVELDWTETSKFVRSMWDVYRDDYPPVWTMAPKLTIDASGGTVAKVPDKAAYTLGDRVGLRAVADPGYEFAGWSGELSGQSNPIEIIMHSNRSITAKFSLVEHLLKEDK